MKKLIFIASLFCAMVIVTGCSEGENVNGQKQIYYSFTATGDSENWNITDKVTGTYYNMEQLIDQSHDITIQPKTTIDSNEISISIKIGDKLLSLNNDAGKQTKFIENEEPNGSYTMKQDGFTLFDENEEFWDEDITIIIKHGKNEEEIKLN